MTTPAPITVSKLRISRTMVTANQPACKGKDKV